MRMRAYACMYTLRSAETVQLLVTDSGIAYIHCTYTVASDAYVAAQYHRRMLVVLPAQAQHRHARHLQLQLPRAVPLMPSGPAACLYASLRASCRQWHGCHRLLLPSQTRRRLVPVAARAGRLLGRTCRRSRCRAPGPRVNATSSVPYGTAAVLTTGCYASVLTYVAP